MANILICILIMAAVVAVVIKKIRDFSKGKFCDSGCGDCQENCLKRKINENSGEKK